MATLVARGVIRFGAHRPYAVNGTAVKSKRYTSTITKYKRGVGGRSSFSGTVATVFGASGNVGRGLVNRLGKTGSQVIVPYRGADYDVKDLKLSGDLGQILFTPYDPMDEESIYRCMKYSNMVVNLIGQEVPDRNYNLHDAHVVTPRLIASAARQAGIKTMVHFSAMGATLDPPTPWTKEEAEEYAKKNIILGKSDFLITKYLGEQAVQNEFPDAVIVRPSTLFGICDNFINFYSANGRKGRCVLGTYTVYMWKKGLEAIKRPLFVSDLLDAVEVLMRDKSARGKTYEFYGPHAYLLHDLVEYISNIQRTTLKIEHGLLWRRSFTGYYSGGYKSEDGTLILHDKSNTEYLSDIPSGLPGFEECGISRKKLQSIIDLAPIFLRNTADVTNTELEQSYYAKPIPPQPVLV